MARRTKPSFHEYRYQILPISRDLQLTIGSEILSLDELIARKNDFFWDALKVVDFSDETHQVNHRFLEMSDHRAIIELAVARTVKLQTKDFSETRVENWPTVVVVFDNSPDVQKCLIQRKAGGFAHTRALGNLITRAVNKHLEASRLTVELEAIYDEEVFWDLTQRYKGRITGVEFSLVTPNMSNISSSLTDEMIDAQKSFSAVKTDVAFKSDPNGSLVLPRDSDVLRGLVDYASKGGGDIRVKVRGLRKISTSTGINEITIDELDVDGMKPGQTMKLFEELLK